MGLECGQIDCNANSINTGMKCNKSHSFGLTRARRETYVPMLWQETYVPTLWQALKFAKSSLEKDRAAFPFLWRHIRESDRLQKQHGLFLEILYFVHRLGFDRAKAVLMAREGKPNNSFDTEIASNSHFGDWRSIWTYQTWLWSCGNQELSCSLCRIILSSFCLSKATCFLIIILCWELNSYNLEKEGANAMVLWELLVFVKSSN